MADRNIQEVLAEIRQARDRIDEIDAHRKTWVEVRDKAESLLLAMMEADGLCADGDKVAGGGITATVQKAWRTKYEPAKWPTILAWAVENGHTDLVQRRLTDSKTMELVDGGVALPDGLTVEPYTRLAMRRTG